MPRDDPFPHPVRPRRARTHLHTRDMIWLYNVLQEALFESLEEIEEQLDNRMRLMVEEAVSALHDLRDPIGPPGEIVPPGPWPHNPGAGERREIPLRGRGRRTPPRQGAQVRRAAQDPPSGNPARSSGQLPTVSSSRPAVTVASTEAEILDLTGAEGTANPGQVGGE